MNVTAYDLAERFVGMSEVPGSQSNPAILAMLKLDQNWPTDDETPWCSAFTNWIAWLLRLPRSKSLRARSWLGVGQPIPLANARPAFDVVILNRGGPQDPDVIDAPGHVGFFAGLDASRVYLLGGNQADRVSVAAFHVSSVLGVRRLA
jgi:uncharacterized protein (TIGR02594 family)